MAKFVHRIRRASLLSTTTRLLGNTIGCCLIISMSWGCALNENPSVDELFGQGRVVTASAEVALAADVSINARQRGFTTTLRPTADGHVTHGALYFLDGFEETAHDDGRFSWSYEDQLAMPLGVARYLINVIAMPISVLRTPPGAVMVSNGHSATPTKPERT